MRKVFIAFFLLAAVGCSRLTPAVVSPAIVPPPPPLPTYEPVTVSYYGKEFAGRPTASGEIFNPNGLTAAHKKLPFGTLVEVRDPDTKKSVQVRINDRGPFAPGRDLDISAGAAKELGVTGVHKLEMRVVR